jgi:hypothetical protein
MRTLAPTAAFVLVAIVATACQSDSRQQTSSTSTAQTYCVNRNAQFYPYEGEPCASRYMLGSGNCHAADGRLVAVLKDQCVAMAGTVELPFEIGLQPGK